MRSASRYLATVRRAMSTPSCRSAATIASSDRMSSGRLRVDQAANAMAHRLGAVALAIRAGDRGGEEILQLERAARRRDVLVGGHAADGALVHLHRLGDVAQDQRAQMRDAVAEEAVLLADDLGGHLQDGLRPLLQRAHQPVGARQLLGQEDPVLLARARRDPRVEALVHQHARHRLRVQLDQPAAVRRWPHQHVRHHQLRRRRSRSSPPASDRARGSRRSCRPGLRHRRRRSPSAGAGRAAPAGPDCRAAPASPDPAGCARRAARPGTPSGRARTARPDRSASCARAPPRRAPAAAPSRRRSPPDPAVSRPAGHSSAIRCAPIMRSTGSSKDSRSCSPRCSRSGRPLVGDILDAAVVAFEVAGCRRGPSIAWTAARRRPTPPAS